MRKYLYYILFFLVFAGLLIFFLQTRSSVKFEMDGARIFPSSSVEPSLPEPLSFQDREEYIYWSKYKDWSLEKKVGQVFFIGYYGYTPSSSLNDWIQNKGLGGVIAFSRNISSDSQIKKLNGDIQAEAEIPLFVGVDQEGGLVARLSSVDSTPQSSITNIDDAKNIAKKRAEEMKALGFNTNFSPVSDYITSPASFLYSRVFHKDVDTLSSAMVEGYREGGVISVPKHFPGHTNEAKDTHLKLPVVTSDPTSIDVFKNIIGNSNPSMIMAAHVIYKDKDKLPASLSKYWIKDTLKDSLGFNGLVITDDITMSAISDNFSPEQIINNYLDSDMDILLVCHYEDYQNQLYDILLKKAKDDPQIREKIENKFKRILAIKFRNLY